MDVVPVVVFGVCTLVVIVLLACFTTMRTTLVALALWLAVGVLFLVAYPAQFAFVLHV